MTPKLKDMLQKAEAWPEWAQVELLAAAEDIHAGVSGGVYHATDEELRKIDEGLAAAERGEIASDAEVEAVFAKHRRG